MKKSLNAEQMFGDNKVILVAQSELKEYVDGKSTDRVIGVKIKVSAPGACFENFNVKIEGGKFLNFTEEEIEEACATMNPIWVRFVGFQAKPYIMNNNICYSCSASSVEVVDEDEIEL